MAANDSIEKDQEFTASQFHFKAEVINDLARKLRLTLNRPRALMCFMRVGASRQLTVSEGEDFRVTAAMIVDNPEITARYMKLRIEPVKRQEYRFADLLMKELDGFSGTITDDFMNEARYENWDALYLAMLRQPCRARPEYSYQQIIEAALATEKSRILKQSIQSHSDFGSW